MKGNQKYFWLLRGEGVEVPTETTNVILINIEKVQGTFSASSVSSC